MLKSFYNCMVHTGGAGVRKGVVDRTAGTLSVKSPYLLQKRSPSELLPVSPLSNHVACGRPENGHRSVTYQHFAGPASCVLRCTEKGSRDL